ncbi:insulinase family protein [Halomonas sp. KM-1]|uniref:insulinase family protein n=1 Tax=Halomonas sp. KM-1 TaxID=590061 RepID=UPI0002886A4B|nr:insulinase family protein [Halomonas sp. KM-1]
MNGPAATYDEAARSAGLPLGSCLVERRLDNGLWIAAAQVPSARVQRLVGAVGVGYLDEPDDCRGLAHLLEHALFLGSANFPEAGELARWIGERGGRYNARTDETVTDVHLHLPPDEADEGLARLVDMLARPCFEPAHIAHEVEVLDAEFRARLADPALHRLAALGRLCREGHPARLCHAGNRKSLGDDAAHLATRLSDFHTRHYRSGGMALAMLGPLPLDEQLALLTHHGAALPVGELSPLQRSWRWGEPAGVAWHSSQTTPGTSALELIWPLPQALAAAHGEWLEAVAARLSDGRLAATLQAAVELDSFDVTLTPQGVGTALALRLAPAPDEETVQTLLAACRTALERALASPLATRPAAPVELDVWPRRCACRLAGLGSSSDSGSDGLAAPREALQPWLAVEQCRLLWQSPSAPGSWKRLAETGTAWHPQPLASETLPLPWRAAPALSARTLRPSVDEPGPYLVNQGVGFQLWAGDPLRLPDAAPASFCLGWSASLSRQAARLAQWRQNALPLRQAAAVHGLELRCDGDARGDWLIATGPAERLDALVELAVACWPETVTRPHDEAPKGLLAQRMLTRLETLPPPGTPGQQSRQPLAWVHGDTDTQAAETLLRRLAARRREDDTSYEVPAELHWLSAQGDDHAAMLEIAGPDDTPRSRWLLQLLAQCHDAAFHHEMRQRRGLGYVAAVRYREAAGYPRLGYVVQSPGTSVDALRQAIGQFLTRQGEALARLDQATMTSRKRALLAAAGPPETHAEAVARLWHALRRHPLADAWQPLPWEAESQTLASLHADELTAMASAIAEGRLTQRWWLHEPNATAP